MFYIGQGIEIFEDGTNYYFEKKFYLASLK